MRGFFPEIGAAAVAIGVACFLLVLQQFTRDRWKQRFGTIESPLIKPPVYRALFVLVFIGVLLISVLPEAALVLPALDAVGLDVVTILVALEVRHYFTSVARLAGIPTSLTVHLRIARLVVSRCRDVLRTNPVLWLYSCMWVVIWLQTLTGRISAPPPAQG